MSSQNPSLKSFNSFGIDVTSRQIVIAETEAQLSHFWHDSQKEGTPFLLLGGGSNVLFLDHYAGTVVINRIQGIRMTQDQGSWHLHVSAGENWHNLVEYTLDHDLYGLENMALIPGCVGAAPIQNIGAYGVELKDVCEYVDVLDLEQNITTRFDSQACQFGYRDSIFKHAFREGYAITAVGFLLKKKWQPVLNYGALARLDPSVVTPRQIFTEVCQMRRSKLPDPAITGNAGSFFKNPVVSALQAKKLTEQFSLAPCYPQADGRIKLAAGWLIDQCQLKGFRCGGAAVHQQQALVLINANNATPTDIVRLAHEVRQQVGDKFGVWLEPEVRFIGADGEKDAVGEIL